MKRRMLAALFAVILMTVPAAAGLLTAHAENAGNQASGAYEFELNKDGTATITNYETEEWRWDEDAYDEIIEIPAELDGHPVTVIGAHAFSGDPFFVEVTVPEGVRIIGDGAFCNDADSTDIAFTIPASVEYIGYEAFRTSAGTCQLRGYEGTFAALYAEQNGISFISLGSVPMTASAFSKGTVAMIGIGGFVFGVLAGTAAVLVPALKRQKVETPDT